MIVVPLLATVFNHAGCSDESPFFKPKESDNLWVVALFLCIGLEPSQRIIAKLLRCNFAKRRNMRSDCCAIACNGI